MKIGALDKLVTIETFTTSKSSANGEETQTWATLASVWATVTYPQGEFEANEGQEQGREVTLTPVNFTIRYRTDVTAKMRVLWDSEYYNITRINKVGQRNEMLKLVTEKKY